MVDASTSRGRKTPADPIGEAVAQTLGDLVYDAEVIATHAPESSDDAEPAGAVAAATAAGPEGWHTTLSVHVNERIGRLVEDDTDGSLRELLCALPVAGNRAVARYRHAHRGDQPVGTALQRAVRDTVAAEILTEYLDTRLSQVGHPELVAETIDYLLELSGTRVEAHPLTHGVIITDLWEDTPRLEFRYPDDIRPAKRAPLLFDGQGSVLVVDSSGRARTELHWPRLERLAPDVAPHIPAEVSLNSGSLVAAATDALGGIGFFLGTDRTIWTFVDGNPLLVRRGERWTAFPLRLSASVADLIGGGRAAALVGRTAYIVSAQQHGAILAIVDSADDIGAVVATKDRYDLRNAIDVDAMRSETRLHHLIDTDDLDEHTLARLAGLDGATVLDRDGRLLAYGAIVTATDSQYEGARTAAARTLSKSALVVIKVSTDGDITIFRDGAAMATLLGIPPESEA